MLAPWVLRVAVVVGVAGCTVGAPPGFSGGDQWTFPLVGPLENGLLIVPVYIHDTGPYLMAIDPDSPSSVIDDALVKQLGLDNLPRGGLVDETDTFRHAQAADVRSLRIGDLTVTAQYLWIMKAGSYQVGGRDLRGVIGRDILADSLVFGFDRDRGVAYLTTQKGFTPAAGAATIDYEVMVKRDNVTGRRMVKAQVGAITARVHLDLGAATSQLREKLWAGAALARVAGTLALRDEAGTIRHVEAVGVADRVTAGPVSASHVALAPYDDKRWDEEFIDGTLALDAFRDAAVWANWNAKRLYVVPRGDLVATAKERVARWHSPVLDGCAQLGCVAIKLLEPSAATAPAAPAVPDGTAPEAAPPDGAIPAPPTPPPGPTAPARPMLRPRPVLMVNRDPAATGVELELVLAALGADERPVAGLPRLIVNLPAGSDTASTQLPPAYLGTHLVVLDASLFPRPCPRGGGCIDSLAAD